jgi:hypothetical protein
MVHNHSTKNIGTLSTSIFKKGERMSQENPISLAIREIKSLSLSKWGQIRLSCYPDEAIKNADESFRFAYNLKNPFGFFVQLCQEYCKNNGIIPDWNHYSRLAMRFEMKPDAPMLIEKKKDNAQEKSPLCVKYNSPQKQEVESKTPDRQVFYDPNRNFKTGCTLDHEKEIAKFNHQLATIETSQFAKLTGTEYAKNYMMRIIDNHETCLNSNHVQF